MYFLGQDDIEFRKRSKTWPSRRKPWKRPCGVFIGQEHVHPAQQLVEAAPFSGWVPIGIEGGRHTEGVGPGEEVRQAGLESDLQEVGGDIKVARSAQQVVGHFGGGQQDGGFSLLQRSLTSKPSYHMNTA